ncbi:MAG: M18 family aminopeptidase [Lachnospiraceae bacterium]|nr:M18 family aminopeptidase [Lachnospiraceae bacterium]
MTIRKLNSFISKATCSYMVVEEVSNYLENAGFIALNVADEWKLAKNGRYYVKIYDTSLMAFTVGEKEGKLRIAAAHTDSPALKIKASPDMLSEGCTRLNVEGYGGAVLHSWFNRPIGISGKVFLKGEDIFTPVSMKFDSGEGIGIIPELAIHMNREVNKGVEVSIAKDMLPVLCTGTEEEGFEKYLASKLNVSKEDILSYELYAYICESGEITGLNKEFYVAPRLDNLTSSLACIEGIINGNRDEGINVSVLFDNEEIGSATKQGAGSQMFSMVMEKIYLSLGYSRERLINDYFDGMMLSVDVAHGVNPNRPEKSDNINKVRLNEGIVIKTTGTYAYDGKSISIIKGLCEKYDIKYQIFTKQSDSRGGGTLGAIADTMVPMSTLDIGVPIWGMHSAKEIMGIKDQKYLEELVKHFFSE